MFYHFLNNQQVRKCGFGRAALFNHESSEPHWNNCLKKTGHWADLWQQRHHKILGTSDLEDCGSSQQLVLFFFSACPRLMPVAVLQKKNPLYRNRVWHYVLSFTIYLGRDRINEKLGNKHPYLLCPYGIKSFLYSSFPAQQLPGLNQLYPSLSL